MGRVGAPRGLRGEVRVEVISDSPGRFEAGGIVFLGGRRRIIQRSASISKQVVGLKLEGIDTREEADKLKGSFLTVPMEMVPDLPEGTYYHFQIIGIQVFTTGGDYLGRVSRILPTGANDVYVVSGDEDEVLVPALEDVIVAVDIPQDRMTVKLPREV